MTADSKRRVRLGEEVEVALPYSEVCMHLRVAGQLRRVRVLGHGVQILNADGADFSFPIGHGEAGLYRDSEGLYAPALPEHVWRAYRNGERTPAAMTSNDACEVWLFHPASRGLPAGQAGEDSGWEFRREPYDPKETTVTADSKLRVQVGDEVLMGMPRTDACQKLKISQQVRLVRILPDGVQVLDHSLEVWRLKPISELRPISYEDAGLLRDGDDLYVPPLPTVGYQVLRDGKPNSPLMTHEDGCFRWVLDRSGRSFDWATRYDGYSVDMVGLAGRPVTYEQYAQLVDARDHDPHAAADSLPRDPVFADWGFRYWTLGMPADREHACPVCGKPFGH